VCLEAVTLADAGWTIEYVPVGEVVVERVLTHYRCTTTWIISRVKPDAGPERFGA
jgi:hypothetical protein